MNWMESVDFWGTVLVRYLLSINNLLLLFIENAGENRATWTFELGKLRSASLELSRWWPPNE